MQVRAGDGGNDVIVKIVFADPAELDGNRAEVDVPSDADGAWNKDAGIGRIPPAFSGFGIAR
ncbi:hypothetical protein J2S70_000479 [Trueperella bonasi]|uniref:Uncharacterized protein n=1 Tax=Trueperella bonasi TaxID=312286 RepID=A0ABT9NEU9_9ACTO|nr:hypothetical protein [Trueperella bonasi]MDP9805897.1 hypothetical protein [Trueperella bonasi]